MVTDRQRRGGRAEDEAALALTQAGWTVIARNVRVGRDEIDLVCVDQGPPRELVFVEVRSGRVTQFGAPEERVDGRKVARLYRSMAAVRAAGALPDGRLMPRLPARVDLVIVDGRSGANVVRHLRRLMPP